MTYTAENKVINKKYQSNFTDTEIKYWRRSNQTTRGDRISNEENRKRMSVKKNILTYIEQIRLEKYGHVRRATIEK